MAKKACRLTHRSHTGTKLYAVRIAKGRFKDTQTYNAPTGPTPSRSPSARSSGSDARRSPGARLRRDTLPNQGKLHHKLLVLDDQVAIGGSFKLHRPRQQVQGREPHTKGSNKMAPPISELVSYRKPDGFILSTGNLYFTYHDAATASVWRAAQSAVPARKSFSTPSQDAALETSFSHKSTAFGGDTSFRPALEEPQRSSVFP